MPFPLLSGVLVGGIGGGIPGLFGPSIVKLDRGIDSAGAGGASIAFSETLSSSDREGALLLLSSLSPRRVVKRCSLPSILRMRTIAVLGIQRPRCGFCREIRVVVPGTRYNILLGSFSAGTFHAIDG